MTGKTHQIIGLTTGVLTFLALTDPSYNPATLAAAVVVSSIGALLPDIDQPTADLWNKIPFGKVAGEIVNPFLEHRNLTHSLLGIAIVGWASHALLDQAPSYWGLNQSLIFWAFLASYCSHLLADMVTVQGIPLLFPLQRNFGLPPRPFQGIRIETGQWFENLIIFPLANAACIALIISQWPLIRIILFK